MIPKKKLMPWLKWIAIVYILVGLILYCTQELFLFQGKKIKANIPYTFNDMNYTEQNMTRADGSILSYVQFMPSDTIPKGIVLYFHGNMGNINRYAPYTRLFTLNGYKVYMMDYAGFGKSTGNITEQGMYTDAMYMYKLARQTVAANQIILYGKSMGTGVANYIASTQPCGRVILETPYYSLPTVYDDFTWIYPTRYMIRYQMPSYKYIPLIQAPITIFHGTHDALISIANASRLKPLLKPTDAFITIPNAAHNNIVQFPVYTTVMDSLLSM